MRRYVAVAIILTFISGIAFAQSQFSDDSKTIRIKGVKVDGGAMSAVGVTLTTLADNAPAKWSKFMKYAGWGLIVGGLLIGSGSIENANATEVQAKPVWKAMVSEARLVQGHSSLIDSSSPIVNAANKSGIDVNELADLTTRVDLVTSTARAEHRVLSVKEVVKSTSANAQEEKLASNMAIIALMSN